MYPGVAVAAQQKRYIRKFTDAQATESRRAVSLEEIGCRKSQIFKRMVRQGLFIEVSAGRYYMDSDRVNEVASRRRMVAVIALAIAFIVILFLIASGAGKKATSEEHDQPNVSASVRGNAME